MLPFFSTHNHTEISNFRLRDCIIKLDELINRAIELGYNGICCTDHEALSGHVRLIKRYKDLKKWRSILDKYETWEELEQKEDKDDVKKIKKNMKWLEKFSSDFKLGLGNEIYLIDRPEEAEKIAKFYHFILIAKDAKGYEQLRRISSSAWEHWFKQGRMERVPTYKDELEAIIGDEKGHIIAQSACLGSELDNLILRYIETNDISYKKQIHHFIQWCIKVFGKENFFLEIQPCGNYKCWYSTYWKFRFKRKYIKSKTRNIRGTR